MNYINSHFFTNNINFIHLNNFFPNKIITTITLKKQKKQSFNKNKEQGKTVNKKKQKINHTNSVIFVEDKTLLRKVNK